MDSGVDSIVLNGSLIGVRGMLTANSNNSNLDEEILSTNPNPIVAAGRVIRSEQVIWPSAVLQYQYQNPNQLPSAFVKPGGLSNSFYNYNINNSIQKLMIEPLNQAGLGLHEANISRPLLPNTFVDIVDSRLCVHTSSSHNNHNNGRPPVHPLRKGTPSYRQTHVHSERQRRQAMSNLFATLRSLLPMSHHIKPDRCTIVSYIINHVKYLQSRLNELSKTKAQQMICGSDHNVGNVLRRQHVNQKGKEMPYPWNLIVRHWGTNDIFITLSSPKRKGIWPLFLFFVEGNLKLDIQSTTLSTTSTNIYVHFIYAKVDGFNDAISWETLEGKLWEFLIDQFKAAMKREHNEYHLWFEP